MSNGATKGAVPEKKTMTAAASLFQGQAKDLQFNLTLMAQAQDLIPEIHSN